MPKTNQELALTQDIGVDSMNMLSSIHEYWDKNADAFRDEHTASWGDLNLIGLEAKNVAAFIQDGQRVLDAGCANGFTTFLIAKKKHISVKAFDYSQTMITHALRQQEKLDPHRQIHFFHGNILNISEPSDSFNTAYAIRVIINLPTWEMQKQAILEMYRVLKSGGLYLLSEAFNGSLQRLNALRALANLSPLIAPEFNRYLDEQPFEQFVSQHFDIVDIKRFSSIYYVASRFLRYLTMNKNDQDTFVNEINNLFVKFSETDQSGDFGIQKLYVLRKK